MYLFKEDLQKLANQLGIEIRVAHYPPYFSKYNPIEHRLFPHLTWACRQGHRIKIGGLGRMANPAFGENLGFCGTFSHLSTMFVVALVIVNKYNVYVQ